MAFGLFLKKVKLEGLPKVILGIALIIAMLALGIMFQYMLLKQLGFMLSLYIFFLCFQLPMCGYLKHHVII